MNTRTQMAAPALAIVMTACTPATKQPMPTTADPAGTDPSATDTLVVFLPGRGDRGPDFAAQRFFEIGQDGGFDMIAADAHFGYYMDRTLDERLHADVMVPARQRGYDRIWLVGISAGGLGAMLYSQKHPEMIDGMVLLAPFLGDPPLIREISAAGGLAQWSGQSDRGEAFQRRTWRWLEKATAKPGAPSIVVGYGRADRFAEAADLLAARLPRDRVFTVEGGHDWPTWRRLWRRVVAAGLPSTPPAQQASR